MIKKKELENFMEKLNTKINLGVLLKIKFIDLNKKSLIITVFTQWGSRITSFNFLKVLKICNLIILKIIY